MFILIVLSYLLVAFFMNHFIITESLFVGTFGSQLSYEQINKVFSFQQQWQWLGYIILPLWYLIKIFIVSACLATGCYLSSYKIRYTDIFKVVLVGEVMLLIGIVIKIIILSFGHLNTLADVQNFNPLSLAQLIGVANFPQYLLYCVQTINLFEITYWIVLAAGLAAFIEKPFGKMFALVLKSYGVGLLLWMVFVIFMTLNFSV